MAEITEKRRCAECAHVALSPIAPPRCFADGNASVVGYATYCATERVSGNCGKDGLLWEPAPPTVERKPWWQFWKQEG